MCAMCASTSTEKWTVSEGIHQLKAATWNIAAVNNNPFDYWVTYPDKGYSDFMIRVEHVISKQNELLVSQIFTESILFLELVQEL